jgi:peptide/nickel transport system permease protein
MPQCAAVLALAHVGGTHQASAEVPGGKEIHHLLRRSFALLPVALGVATLTFALIHFVPGDPVIAMLGDNAQPADVAGLRHQLGLDQPLWRQYFDYLSGIVRGDLGESLSMHQPVVRLIAERYPATLQLAAAGLIVAIVIAFPLGLVAGANPDGVLDTAAMGVAVLGISVPHLCLGPLLMIVFSVHLRWLPLTGMGGFSHLILPALTLGTALAAIVARMLRQSVARVLATDYMRTARSKGISRGAALLRHGLRNALIPVITLLGLEMGALLTGSIVTEVIFSWPGLGRLMIGAIGNRDYPLVEGCVLTFALSYVVANMVTDLLYGRIDPRIRLERG